MALRQKIALQKCSGWRLGLHRRLHRDPPVVAQQKSAETSQPARQPVRVRISSKKFTSKPQNWQPILAPGYRRPTCPAVVPIHNTLVRRALISRPVRAAGTASAIPRGAGQPLAQSPKQQSSDSVSGKTTAAAAFPNSQGPAAGASPHPQASRIRLASKPDDPFSRWFRRALPCRVPTNVNQPKLRRKRRLEDRSRSRPTERHHNTEPRATFFGSIVRATWGQRSWNKQVQPHLAIRLRPWQMPMTIARCSVRFPTV